MKIKNKKKGILFWITGLSGSGKTTLGKKITKDIEKIHGPTIMISGDDIREIFKLKGFEYDDRLKITKKYCQFVRYITNQKINVIFAVVGMFDDSRKWNKLNIDNYVEIYIKSNIKTILRIGKKKIYNKNNPGKFIGIEIKPEYPKNPDITILNKFNSTSNKMAKLLMNKINKLLNEKK
jgi:adenylylsulfate kinase-like enzyme